MNKDNITKGKFGYVLDDLDSVPYHEVYEVSNEVEWVAYVRGSGESQAMSNADLITETFNVFTETNQTPRELMEANKELLDALKSILPHLGHYADLHISVQKKYLNASKLIKKHSTK